MAARTIPIDSGGVARVVKRWLAIDSGDVARALKRAFIVDAGGIARLIFVSITASISPTDAEASGFAPINLTTNLVTATPVGGSAPDTYAWTWFSGGTGITISSPSTASTAFSAHLTPGQTLLGIAQCTITDAHGAQASATCVVNISATN